MNIDNLSDDSISRLKQKRSNNFFNLKFNDKIGYCSIYKSQTMQPFFINLQINKLFTESEARIERIARKMFVEMWNNSNNYIYKKGEKEFIGVIVSKNHFDDICNSYYIKEEEKEIIANRLSNFCNMIHSESKDLDNNQIRILNPHQASKLNIRIAPNGIFMAMKIKMVVIRLNLELILKLEIKGINHLFLLIDGLIQIKVEGIKR
jgi:hypothetical protein